MNAQLIKRATYETPKGQRFIADMQLARARAHEFCGPARRTLALFLARQMNGPIYWIQSAWEGDRLHGPGIAPYVDPTRITFVRPKRFEDLLWSTEEVLRAGCIPLVVTELPDPPPLTPVRRLHLAAETGAKIGTTPLSILLTPGDGGAQGVESRWHLTPTHRVDEMRWLLTRRRARMAPPAGFEVTWDGRSVELAEGRATA